MRVPRLLVCSHPAVLGVNRGVYRALAEIAEVEVIVVAPTRWKADLIVDLTCAEEPADAALSLRPTPIVGRRLPRNNSLFLFRSRLSRSLGSWQPDIVIAEEEPWSLAAFQIYRSFPRARRAFYTDQNIFKRHPSPFRQTEKWVFSQTNVALTRSDSSGDVLRKKGYRGPIHFSPHSYDPVLFRSLESTDRLAARLQLGISGDTILVGYAGRLTEEKGIEDLLEAWAQLPGITKAKATLLIIGNGPLEATVTAASSDDPSIHRIPALSHEKIGRMIGSLDLLVLPSRTTIGWKEQWGRVIVEAAACGVPVVGSDSGEIPKLVSRLEVGVTVPERSPGELSLSISTLVDDRASRTTLGMIGRKRAMEQFSHHTVAASLAEYLGLDIG